MASIAILVSLTLSLASPLARPALASCAPSTFLFTDDFESGDTSAWGASPVDGVWLGSLDFAGSSRPFAIQLAERRDRRLLGYLLGGTPYRTVVGGERTGSDVVLELDLATPLGARAVSITASLVGGQLVGSASGLEGGPQAITLTRVGSPLQERRFLFAELGAAGARYVTHLAVALDDGGSLVAGGFVGQDGCRPFACDGGVTSFSEIGDHLVIGLETDGGCSTGSTLDVTFRAATLEGSDALYLGSYSFTDCSGTKSGSLFGVRLGRARSDDVACLLAGLGDVADQLEAEIPFSTSHPLFAPDYLHDGQDLSTLFAAFNDEMSAWDEIAFDLDHFETISTEVEPDVFPRFRTPLGAAFRWQRSGTPSGGGSPTAYESPGPYPIHAPLRGWRKEAGTWVMEGNRQAALTFPFPYIIEPSSPFLRVATLGDPIWVSLGGFGGNAAPVAFHPEGDGKANLAGFLVRGDSEMTELVGDGDGVRDPGETWGLFGETDGSGIRNRIPPLRAPQAASIERITYLQGPDAKFFDNEPHWVVTLVFPGGTRFDLLHLGRIAAPLRDRVLAATCAAGACVDTDTFSASPGTEILTGLDPLAVPGGEALAYPHTFADAVPGYPGYFTGGGAYREYPWVEIELNVISEAGGIVTKVCPYRLFSSAESTALRQAMELDMLDPDSLRYRDRYHGRWRWAGQADLCVRESQRPFGLAAMETDLGGWPERDDTGATADEILSWVPVDTTTAVYDASLYDPSAVGVVLLRYRASGVAPHSWLMPDGSTVTPDQPAAELLEDDGSSWLLKWRETGYVDGMGADIPVYQRAAYRLDRDGLAVVWGAFAETPETAVTPTLASGTPCGGAVLCYSHELFAGL